MSLETELVAHSAAVVKVGAGIAKDGDKYINEMRRIVRKRVAGFDSERRTNKRLEKLLEQLEQELIVPAGEWRRELQQQLRDFAKYEAAYQAETIGGWVGVNMTQPTVSQVWAAAKFNPIQYGTKPQSLIGMMKGWEANEVSRLVMGVKAGFVRGDTSRQIIKDVVGNGGLADISKRDAATVARTATAHVATEARVETFKDNSDVVKGYTLSVVLDSGTSAICRAWDESKVYQFGDGPLPPFHPNCRTVILPVLSKEYNIFDFGAKRAARGSSGGQQVTSKKTYYGFLKDQSADFQDEVLGKTKGRIFRNAGLTTEEFRKVTVDDLGRPLTIGQMAARDKRIARYLKKAA